jgi:hypothetical protein
MMQCGKCGSVMARLAFWDGTEFFQCQYCGHEETLSLADWSDGWDDYSDYDPNHIINNYDPNVDDIPL